MSIKNNALLVAALAALGVSTTAGAVAEGLCDNYTVSDVKIAQVNERGGCVVIVSVNSGVAEAVQVRAVANSNGDVRVFSDLASASGFVKRAKFAVDTDVSYKRMIVQGSVGDPIAKLKGKFKAAKAEKVASAAKIVQITALETAGTANGWNTAVGTNEYLTFQDYGARKAIVQEVNTKAAAAETQFAADLTAAGIDPLTVI